jgi:hypothetical protein
LKFLSAATVALAAFLLYHATLLPGVDFGDTGSFQATVGSADITPRDGYPLYFALGGLVLAVTHAEPARALNLASALEGAVAIGLFVLVAAELSGSAWAAAAAALVFAGSYTFWSQATIAEVYALHAVFLTLTLWLLLRWQQRPSTARLAVFFGAYALGFGNHLSMVLLLPAYTVFLLAAAPGGWRSMVRPHIVLLAVALAALGALQYAWNARALWQLPHPPATLADAARMFWFDVTKSDWRETMVGQVPASMLPERLAMFAFDLRQQFGWLIPAVAAAGLVRLWRQSWRTGLLLAGVWIANAAFAFVYNVGDTHVFVLPAHLTVALLAAPGLAALAAIAARASGSRSAAAAVAVAAFAWAGARLYADYPALDRSADRRPSAVLETLTAGLDDQHAILLTDLNWQVQNGLSYFTRERPGIAAARMPDVLLYAPALVRDNLAISRDVVVTGRAAADLEGLYGPLFAIARDARVAAPSLRDRFARVPPGTRYVLTVLKPSRDLPLDEEALADAVSALGATLPHPLPDYVAVAGITGRAPAFVEAADRPFRRSATLGGTPVAIRMESWLAFDTIRRMGFGQVVAARRHTLIVERGVSFAAFDAEGGPIETAYAWNIFAPQPRFLVTPGPAAGADAR